MWETKEIRWIPYVQFFIALEQKECGLSSTGVIPVLDPLPEDLLDLFSNPLSTVPSQNFSFHISRFGLQAQIPQNPVQQVH